MYFKIAFWSWLIFGAVGALFVLSAKDDGPVTALDAIIWAFVGAFIGPILAVVFLLAQIKLKR